MDHHSISNLFYFFPQPTLLLSTVTITVLLVMFTIFFILSFLMSGSEVAFFSLSQKELNLLKTRERPGFRRIVLLLNQPKNLLATMMIANTFFNIGLILIFNVLLSEWIPGNGKVEFVAKIFIISLVLIVFAEMLPKVWATHHKVMFASSSSLILEIFNSLFYGLSKNLVKLGDNIEGRFKSDKYIGLDESHLDEAIDLLPDDEASMEEKEMLKGIRKFSDTEVRQIMRARMDVVGIPEELTMKELMTFVEEQNYSRLPVFKNNLDDIVGLLHTKDLLPFIGNGEGQDWRTLIRPGFFVPEKKYIKDLLQEFRNQRKHFAIVVDEFGGTSGIVTLEDIVEEVIGDIRDEFDDEESGNKKLDDHNYIFEGRLMIYDLCKALGLPVDTFETARGEADSVAGLVLELAGEFPKENDQFVVGNYIFTPLEINKNRIVKVQVTIQKNVEQ